MESPEGQDLEETVDPVETEQPSSEAKEDTQEATLLAGLNESEIKRLLASAAKVEELEQRLAATQDELIDTRTRLHGRFGEVNSVLKQLKEREPAGVPQKLTPDKFKRIKEHWGDEATQALAEDLSELVVPASGDKEAPEYEERLKKMDAYYQGRLNALSEEMMERDRKELSRLRPTWKEEKATPEFALFKSQLPTEDRATFDTSWDAYEVNGIYQKFDKWKERSLRQTTKDKRLEGAIQPRGQSTSDHSVSERAAFAEGFKSVMGKRYIDSK